MGTRGRVRLGPADLLDRAVRDGEIDLPSGGTRLRGREPEATEQALGDPVVSLVLDQRASAPVRQTTLAAIAFDQSKIFEGCRVTERRRCGEVERRRDPLERHSLFRRLVRPDRLEGVELSASQFLQRLHSQSQTPTAYIYHPLIIRYTHSFRVRPALDVERGGRDPNGPPAVTHGPARVGSDGTRLSGRSHSSVGAVRGGTFTSGAMDSGGSSERSAPCLFGWAGRQYSGADWEDTSRREWGRGPPTAVGCRPGLAATSIRSVSGSARPEERRPPCESTATA